MYTVRVAFDVNVNITIPQLAALGENIMANLGTISSAIDTLSATLDTELAQIYEALATMTGPTQDEVDSVAARVEQLQQRIANIIP